MEAVPRSALVCIWQHWQRPDITQLLRHSINA